MTDVSERFWTTSRDASLRAFHSSGASARRIAQELGVSNTTVSKRIKELGLTEHRRSVPSPEHIERYRDARRGFSVPPHLEDRYHELLKTGLPIAEVCRQLGIQT